MFVHQDKKNVEVEDKLTAAYASYAGTSTWHGIPDLFLAKGRVVKIFWLAVLLCSCGMLTYQMYNVIDDFSQAPHYRVSMAAVVLPNGVPFPNVTVCNMARASKAHLSATNMDLESLSYLYGSLAQYYKTSSVLQDEKTGGNTSTSLQSSYQKWAKTYTKTSLDPIKIFDYLGHTCKDTMVRCFWTGIEFDCCQFSRSLLTAYGKCYSVTPPPDQPYLAYNPPTQNIQGPGNALTLWMDPNLPDAAQTVINDFLAEGLIISLSDDPAFWPSDPLILEPKSNNYITVSSEMNSYGQPKVKIFDVPCRANPQFTFVTGRYSISKCVMDCFMTSVMKYCACVYHMGTLVEDYRNDRNLRLCDIDDQLCYTQILYGLHGWSQDAFLFYLNCTNFCLSPCEANLAYKSTVSRTLTSTVLIDKMAQLGVTNAENLIQAEIYFPFIGYTQKITAEKTSIFDLIGNIGGQMGVWAGMSIISWIQIGFYLGRICCCRCLTERVSRLKQRIYVKVRPTKSVAN